MKKYLVLLLFVCAMSLGSVSGMVQSLLVIQTVMGTSVGQLPVFKHQQQYQRAVEALELTTELLDDDDFEELIAARIDSLRHCDYSEICVICLGEISDAGCRVIAKKLGHRLVGFYVEGKHHALITDEGLGYLATHCPNMRELVLTGSILACVTETEIIKMTRLEKLHLVRAPQVVIPTLFSGLDPRIVKDVHIKTSRMGDVYDYRSLCRFTKATA